MLVCSCVCVFVHYPVTYPVYWAEIVHNSPTFWGYWTVDISGGLTMKFWSRSWHTAHCYAYSHANAHRPPASTRPQCIWLWLLISLGSLNHSTSHFLHNGNSFIIEEHLGYIWSAQTQTHRHTHFLVIKHYRSYMHDLLASKSVQQNFLPPITPHPAVKGRFKIVRRWF